MNTSLKYTVQIITEPTKLTDAFRLRYQVYNKVYPKITKDLTQPFESDAFDARSIHLGLYYDAGFEKKLVGYCRLILPEHFISDYHAFIVSEHKYYGWDKETEKLFRLYFFQFMETDAIENVTNFCKEMESNNTIYAETSRFIIDEAHRCISIASFFTSGIYAFAQVLNINFSFFSCDEHHNSFYKKQGLTPFELLPDYYNKVFDRIDSVFGTDISFEYGIPSLVKFLKMQWNVERQMSYVRAA